MTAEVNLRTVRAGMVRHASRYLCAGRESTVEVLEPLELAGVRAVSPGGVAGTLVSTADVL